MASVLAQITAGLTALVDLHAQDLRSLRREHEAGLENLLRERLRHEDELTTLKGEVHALRQAQEQHQAELEDLRTWRSHGEDVLAALESEVHALRDATDMILAQHNTLAAKVQASASASLPPAVPTMHTKESPAQFGVSEDGSQRLPGTSASETDRTEPCEHSEAPVRAKEGIPGGSYKDSPLVADAAVAVTQPATALTTDTRGSSPDPLSQSFTQRRSLMPPPPPRSTQAHSEATTRTTHTFAGAPQELTLPKMPAKTARKATRGTAKPRRGKSFGGDLASIADSALSVLSATTDTSSALGRKRKASSRTDPSEQVNLDDTGAMSDLKRKSSWRTDPAPREDTMGVRSSSHVGMPKRVKSNGARTDDEDDSPVQDEGASEDDTIAVAPAKQTRASLASSSNAMVAESPTLSENGSIRYELDGTPTGHVIPIPDSGSSDNESVEILQKNIRRSSKKESSMLGVTKDDKVKFGKDIKSSRKGKR